MHVAVSFGFVVVVAGSAGAVVAGVDTCSEEVDAQHASNPTAEMAVISLLATASGLRSAGVKVELCDTGSPKSRIVCHQSGCYQDRRFKKGGSLRDSYRR